MPGAAKGHSRVRRQLLLLSLAALVAACGAPPESREAAPRPLAPAETAPPEKGARIYVTSNGWHSEIAVARDDLPAGTIPETEDFPQARYFAFGWGDAEYYPAPRPTMGMALSAALWPTPAVVHLAGLQAPPASTYAKNETLTFRLSAAGLQSLLAYLDASFARAGAPRAKPVAPGLYDFSRFYPATGKFHAFNTCNTWAAKALQAAGLPVDPAGVVHAEDLLSQLRPRRDDGKRRSPSGLRRRSPFRRRSGAVEDEAGEGRGDLLDRSA